MNRELTIGDMTTFTLDARSRKALEELRENIGASSNAEVIRRALTLLQEAARTTKAKGQVLLRSADGAEKQVLIG